MKLPDNTEEALIVETWNANEATGDESVDEATVVMKAVETIAVDCDVAYKIEMFMKLWLETIGSDW